MPHNNKVLGIQDKKQFKRGRHRRIQELFSDTRSGQFIFYTQKTEVIGLNRLANTRHKTKKQTQDKETNSRDMPKKEISTRKKKKSIDKQ